MGESVVITSHGLTIMMIASAVDPEKAGEFIAASGGSLGDCSVTIVQYQDGEFTLESMGDESYRKEGAEVLSATEAE